MQRLEDGVPHSAARMCYGWYVVVAVSLVCAVSGAFTFIAFTFYVTPMEAEFGWSRTETSLGAVANTLPYSLIAPFLGPWLDRRSVRLAMVAGVAVTAVGFLVLHWTGGLFQFYAGWFLVALGRTAFGVFAGVILAARWFSARRGLALAIVNAGPSLGGLALTPVVVAAIDGLGWDGAYLLSAILLPLVVLPVALLVIRDRPPSAAADRHPVDRPRVDHSLGEALRTSAFWVVVPATLLMWAGNDAFVPHRAPFFEERGYSASDAGRFLQLVSVAQLAGYVAAMIGLDRLRRVSLLAALGAAMLAASLGVLAITTTIPAVTAHIALFGVATAMESVLPTLLISRYFGTRALGAILGMVEVPYIALSVAGPVVAGAIYDTTGSYRAAFVLLTAVLGLSAALFAVSRPPRTRAPTQAAADP